MIDLHALIFHPRQYLQELINKVKQYRVGFRLIISKTAEARSIDQDDTQLYPVDLGSLNISCPGCDEPTHMVYVGVTTSEDPDPEDIFASIEQIGVIAYPCGDMFGTPCLTEKVTRILNAREHDDLRLSMLHNLVGCEEHGVDYPGQS